MPSYRHKSHRECFRTYFERNVDKRHQTVQLDGVRSLDLGDEGDHPKVEFGDIYRTQHKPVENVEHSALRHGPEPMEEIDRLAVRAWDHDTLHGPQSRIYLLRKERESHGIIFGSRHSMRMIPQIVA